MRDGTTSGTTQGHGVGLTIWRNDGERKQRCLCVECDFLLTENRIFSDIQRNYGGPNRALPQAHLHHRLLANKPFTPKLAHNNWQRDRKREEGSQNAIEKRTLSLFFLKVHDVPNTFTRA